MDSWKTVIVYDEKMCVFYFAFIVDLSHSMILFGYSGNSLHSVRVTHIYVIPENAFENVVCEMTTILSLPQFFNAGFGSSKVGQFKTSTPPQVTKHISRVYASWKQSWPHSPALHTLKVGIFFIHYILLCVFKVNEALIIQCIPGTPFTNMG